MADSIELKKMYWHSRRGMLELDLILVPFAENILASLTEEEQADYARLLMEEDQDLYQWLVKKGPVHNSALEDIIATVLSHT